MSANGVEYISGCSLLLQRLHQLAGESGYLCFVISIRGTVKPHIFWRSVALTLSRLATLRFCWFAACSGAPSQRWRVHLIHKASSTVLLGLGYTASLQRSSSNGSGSKDHQQQGARKRVT
jgi:hypothetical protein